MLYSQKNTFAGIGFCQNFAAFRLLLFLGSTMTNMSRSFGSIDWQYRTLERSLPDWINLLALSSACPILCKIKMIRTRETKMTSNTVDMLIELMMADVDCSKDWIASAIDMLPAMGAKLSMLKFLLLQVVVRD